MAIHDDREIIDGSGDEEARPASAGRRALLRRGAVAMPAILTLHSGSALAQSSNLISASAPGTRDSLGRTLCLDTSSVYPAGESGDVFDVGYPPRLTVNILVERDHYASKNTGGAIMTEDQVCYEGTTVFYKPDGGGPWEDFTLGNRGVVISTGAALSMADGITDNLM